MTDRELLELAAKAAGIEVVLHPNRGYFPDLVFVSVVTGKNWNPLTDDGDALRLAMDLGITVGKSNSHLEKDQVIASTFREYGVGIWLFEHYGNDKYSAARRAIVRAAAEIGKGMK